MAKNHYKSGEFNVICDVCSKKIKAGESRQRWDGLVVCKDDWETRHSLDFVRAKTDKFTVPFTRPRPADVFVGVTLTAQPNEFLDLQETITTQSDLFRYLGQILYPTDVDVLNGGVLNLLELNHSSIDAPAPVNDELFTLSEAILAIVGKHITISETLSLTENIPLERGKYFVNGFLLNEVTLG